MENKQRTPLKLAIEEVKDQIKKSASEKIRGGDYRIGLTKAINILESLKPKERQMLEQYGNSCAFSQHFHDIKISKMPSSECLDYVNKQTKTIGEKIFDLTLTQE